MAPKTKAEAVKTARTKARAYMEEIHSCAWCTMRALQDAFDMQDENLLKASGALTGGIGAMADTCGSMIAVAMFFGTVCGAGRNEGLDRVDKLIYSGEKAREFFLWFRQKMGTVNCNQILKNVTGIERDYSDPHQFLLATEEGVLEKCTEYVEENAAKAAAMVWDELHKKGKGRNPKL
jgi:C_GCAxxG_C_C family probable redox protein